LTVGEKREYDARNAERYEINIEQMLEQHRAPGGHEPYWGAGHESLSAGIPASQAREHYEWCRSQGLTGIQINDERDGMATVSGSSPGNWKKYLDAKGMVATGKTGAGVEIKPPSRRKKKANLALKKKILERYQARQGTA
jgi:beta-galactosidase/beta-glucuronidase